MPSRIVRILTICLFSCLIGSFVAYKAGYFSIKEASAKTDHLLVQPLVQETIESNSKIELGMSDSVFIMASSSKSGVIIDNYPLVQSLENWLSASENGDSTPRYKDYEQSLDDVLMSSSKVITTTDKSDLALDLKTALTVNWRKVFGLEENSLIAQDSVSLEMVRKIDSLSEKRFMLMVSSKSLVSVNQERLADSLMNIMKKALRLRIDSLRGKD